MEIPEAGQGKAPAVLSQLAQASWAYRLVMGRLTGYRWRQGRHEGVHLYAQIGAEPSSEVDPPLGTLFTEELAARAVADHNAVLDLQWLIAACPEVTIGRRDPTAALEEFWVNVTDRSGVVMWPFQGGSLAEALAKARARAEREGYAP